MEYRYIDRFLLLLLLCVTGSLYVSLLSGEVIVIRYQHIAGCQSLYSYILKGSVSTALTPRGGLQLAHRRHAPPFVLRNGLTPDHHLAEMCRLGRREYKLLESYDEWLRGGVVDPGHYRPDPGDEVPVINIVEDNDPDSEAERLTALLGVMLSPCFDFQSVPADLVHARIPLEGQQAKFARLGWDTIPAAGRLMKRMVEYVEGRVAIHIIAEELDSTGQPYPFDHHDCLYTEDADADADTYDNSDANAAAYGGDKL